MIVFWILLVCAAAMTLAQDGFAGNAIFHTGWYNAVDIALIVLAGLRVRRARSVGIGLAFFGGVLVVAAGAASGLMGPDTQAIVGAPGATVPAPDAGGRFIFPMNAADPVLLERGASVVPIGAGRYTGGLILHERERTVVQVGVEDARGRHLTMTQPTNSSFLSPVLLLAQTTTIAGIPVRYDTFSVPALRKSVKAVYFTADQMARMHGGLDASAAVLFDVVPGGIGMVPSGGTALIGGLRLSAIVRAYPAVVLASAPFLPVLLVGIAIALCGVIGEVRSKIRAA